MSRNAPALLFLLLVVVAFALWLFLKPDPFGDALQEREIAARGLAEHLARTHRDKRAIIVSNPFTQQAGTAKAIVAMERAGVRGLRVEFSNGGLAGPATAFPELRPGARENPAALLADVETTTPLSYLVAPEAFDQMAKEFAGHQIMVSLIGLPVDIQLTEVWKATNAVQFALLLPDLRIIGDAAAVKDALKSGKLAAFVLAKPGTPDDQKVRVNDWRAEFEKRFLLVTPENVEQLLQTYPNLF